METSKLFVGGFPLHYTERDVERLFEQHGRVREVHMLPPKGTSMTSGCCIVKLPDDRDAERCIRALDSTVVPGGHCDRLVVEWSRSKPPRPAPPDRHRDGGAYPPLRTGSPPPARGGREAGGAGRDAGRGRVLYFSVRDDFDHQVDVKLMDKIFSKVGQPEKLVIQPPGERAANPQGWVRMQAHDQCERAIRQFDGECIYRGRMLMRVERSDKLDLSVRFNDRWTWDYLRDLPEGPDMRRPQQLAILDRGGGRRDDRYDDKRRDGDRYDDRRRDDDRIAKEGDAWRDEGPRCGPVVLVSGMSGQTDATTGEPMFSLQRISTLLGVFGDVMRVKIVEARRDDGGPPPGQALVEYRRPEEAANAVQKLSGCPLYGCVLSLKHADKECINPPRGDDPLFLDLYNARAGRFGPKFPLHKLLGMTPQPSNCLYVSGLPETVVEESQLLAVFENFSPTRCCLFRSGRAKSLHGETGPMEGRVEFDDVQSSAEALVTMHEFKDFGTAEGRPDGSGMRVSFAQQTVSKTPLKTIHGEVRRGAHY